MVADTASLSLQWRLFLTASGEPDNHHVTKEVAVAEKRRKKKK